MNIDVRTLLVVHSLVSLTLAVLMVVFWRGHRSTPGLGQWTLATALLGLGVLGGGLRGIIPDFLSIVVANVVGVISSGRVLERHPAVRRPPRALDRRSAGGGRGRGVSRAPDLRRGRYSQPRHRDFRRALGRLLAVRLRTLARTGAHAPDSGVLAAVLFGMVASTLAFRAVSTIVSPPEPDLFAPSAAQSIHFLVSLIGKILVVVSLLMMALQRLQWQLEARNADLEIARGARRGGEPRQVRIPGDDEPRAPHAAQRHHRLFRCAASRDVRAARARALSAIRRRHSCVRNASAGSHHHDPRYLQGGGRKARSRARSISIRAPCSTPPCR